MIAIGEAHWSELANCKEQLSPFRKNKEVYKALRDRLEEEGSEDADPDMVVLIDEKDNKVFVVIGTNSEGHGRLRLYRVEGYENA